MTAREISDAHVAGLSGADMSGYWWYAVRQAHVVAALGHRGGSRRDGPLRYLDLGCGTGGAMASILQELRPEEALGLDGTQDAVDIAASRGLPARFADFRRPLPVPFRPNAITCLDVLEHLEDPVLALRNLADVAAPDAVFAVSVPAMLSLMSRWDELCGHHRRYTRTLLTEHLRAGGWRVERMRHVFSYCVPPAYLQRRILKRVPEFEFPPVSPLANKALVLAGRLERLCGSPMPFGTSLIATARRAT